MKKEEKQKERVPVQGISKKGRRIMLYGIVGYVLAFVILTRVDSEATNWASVISPVLFLASIIVISLGIIAE